MSRDEFFDRCARLGYVEQPKGRSRETFVGKGKFRVRVPNVHGKEINRSAITHFLWEAQLKEEDWNAAADQNYEQPDDDDDNDSSPRRRQAR
jgi:hypothetical protein